MARIFMKNGSYTMTKRNKWDCFLITSFYKRPNMPMWKLMAIYNQPLDGLVRAPKCYMHTNSMVRVFICNSMKSLCNLLWDKEITDAYDIAMSLPDNYDVIMDSYSSRTRDENNERRNNKLSYRAACLERAGWIGFKKDNSRHQHIKALP